MDEYWRVIQEKIKNHFSAYRIVFVPSMVGLVDIEASDDPDSLWIKVSTYWNGIYKAEAETRIYSYDSPEAAMYALIENFDPSLARVYQNENKIDNKVMVVIWRIYPEIVERDGKFSARMRIGIGLM